MMGLQRPQTSCLSAVSVWISSAKASGILKSGYDDGINREPVSTAQERGY